MGWNLSLCQSVQRRGPRTGFPSFLGAAVRCDTTGTWLPTARSPACPTIWRPPTTARSTLPFPLGKSAAKDSTALVNVPIKNPESCLPLTICVADDATREEDRRVVAPQRHDAGESRPKSAGVRYQVLHWQLSPLPPPEDATVLMTLCDRTGERPRNSDGLQGVLLLLLAGGWPSPCPASHS